MRKTILPLLLLLIAFVPTLQAQRSDGGPYCRLKVMANPLEQMKLAGAGVDFDHLNYLGKMHLVGEFSAWERAQMDRLGLSYEVLVDDLQAFYAQQLSTSDFTKVAEVHSQPAAFNFGSMGGYLTLSEVMDELDSMALNFPALVSARDSIGTTVEGRTIYSVKISDNVNVDENEPEVLYDALHHAREPMSLMQLIYYMQYLLENYGTNAEVTYLVNNREMFFVPVVNPDGYAYNEMTDPGGGGMWRKNRRLNPNGTYGVDINRNYGYFWAFDTIGSSPTMSSDRYCGPSAFSEPETQTMRNFCNSRQFKTALNYHSFGNLLIYPWGWLPSYYTPDSTQYELFAQILTDENFYTSGTGNETVNYVTNGSADDWMYGEQVTKGKVMSLTPEVGDANEYFWPQLQYVIPWCELNLRPNLEIAWLAGDYLFVEELINDEVQGTTVQLPAQWTNAGLAASAATTATFIDIDPNVVSVNSSVNLPLLATSAAYTDSFSVTLASAIPNGTVITGIIRTNYAGGFTQDDTVSFVYGIPSILFSDSAEVLPLAWSGGWNYTTERAHTGMQSFTDSPNSPYNDGDWNLWTTTNAIDLSGFVMPKLKFWAQWDIEASWDYCKVSVSTDGNNWTVPDGLYSHPGTLDQLGEYVYDGAQSNWVQEQIDLSPWNGQSIYLRFHLGSDQFFTLDGFYFDDLVVTGYAVSSSNDPQENWVNDLYVFPNPANGSFSVNGWAGHSAPVYLELFTLHGVKVMEQWVNREPVSTDNLAPGVYLVKFTGEGGSSGVKKLAVTR